MTTLNNPVQLFITDYASYNAGEQFKAGAWYNLSDYSDIDELHEAITEAYEAAGTPVDIEDMELMITDAEGVPSGLYSESMSSSEIENLIKFAAMDEEEREKLEAFIDCFGGDFDQALSNYDDAYQGSFSSDADFAEDFAEQCGYEISNNWPHNCIDWERAARDLMFDYSESNGHYFSSNW